MLDAVVDRLKTRVTDFGDRVEGVASVSDLIQSGRAPAHTSAYVLPLGLQGQTADVATGTFRQDFSETIAVLLFASVLDRVGKKALDRVRPLISDVMNAIAGWAPSDELGVFQLRRGSLISLTKGVLIYQIEFSINDQLRIPT
jgi:hypothetical protein